MRIQLTGLLLVLSAMAVGIVDAAHSGRSVETVETTAGNPERGLEYILYGGYVGSGYPHDVYTMLNIGASAPEQPYPRTGANKDIPLAYNAFEARNGIDVVGGIGCLGCHASMFRGELVIGMGNSLSDWASLREIPAPAVDMIVGQKYGNESDEFTIYRQFMRGVEILYPGMVAPFKGVNPAFKIEEIAASHRHPEDLSWSPTPLYETLPMAIASDVPPWWHIQKKESLYYTGMGKGSFAKLMSQINVVGIADKDDAAVTAKAMEDVLAYMMTLQPPTYPGQVDPSLAARGEAVFAANCMKCHGSYGANESYPSKLIPVEEVGTDPAYADVHIKGNLAGWYNRSWYATSPPVSSVEPTRAYIAPPLDGIWATAPYLHNASVPTLDLVLDSSRRPTWWSRSFDDQDYDLERPGWRYTEHDGPDPADLSIYDTTIRGYGNQGHSYGDDLSDAEREALIAYLKTL